MEKRCNIAAVIVLYNPNNEVIENVKSVMIITNNIYVIDNSEEKNEAVIRELLKLKINYIWLGENKGIAKALKIGMEITSKENFSWTVTLDQDSVIPKVDYSRLFELLENNKDKEVAIISLNFNNQRFKKNGLNEVKSWITSGNFVSNSAYKKIPGFNEDLFIDYVDFDLDNQFKKINYKIYVASWISIQHKIGNPIKKSFLGFRFTCMNHSPIRYYYRFRNSYFLYRKDKKFYRKMYFHERVIEYLKVMLFEPMKKEKIRMIKKGIRDAKNNRMGKMIS